MRIYAPEVEISEKEGFSPEKDIFKREAFGKGLMNLVENVDDPLVIALDSPWGSGKTTFIKMWCGLLRNNGFPVIYFDAFANDHTEDAFLAITGEVMTLAEKMAGKEDQKYKEFMNKAVSAGKVLLRSSIKVGMKAATLGAFNQDDFEDFSSIPRDMAIEASTLTDAYLRKRLESHNEEKSAFKSFGEALSSLAIRMGSIAQDPNETTHAKPVVFVIDELDRCRPPYALELLEKIKHFFSVGGVHFVLVTNLDQLENSVRFGYGDKIDAATYLQKFYHLVVRLPLGGEYKYERNATLFLNHIKTFLPDDSSNGSFNRDAADFLRLLAEAKGLSLRTIEKVATNVALVSAFTNDRVFRMPSLVVGLCAMKLLDPKVYLLAQTGELNMERVDAFFEFTSWADNNSNVGDSYRNWWVICLEDIDEGDQHLVDMVRYAFRYFEGDKRNFIPHLCRHRIEQVYFPE